MEQLDWRKSKGPVSSIEPRSPKALEPKFLLSKSHGIEPHHLTSPSNLIDSRDIYHLALLLRPTPLVHSVHFTYRILSYTIKGAECRLTFHTHILLTNLWESRIRQDLEAIARVDTIISTLQRFWPFHSLSYKNLRLYTIIDRVASSW